jgi:hypothetical protein
MIRRDFDDNWLMTFVVRGLHGIWHGHFPHCPNAANLSPMLRGRFGAIPNESLAAPN